MTRTRPAAGPAVGVGRAPAGCFSAGEPPRESGWPAESRDASAGPVQPETGFEPPDRFKFPGRPTRSRSSRASRAAAAAAHAACQWLGGAGEVDSGTLRALSLAVSLGTGPTTGLGLG